MVVAPVWHLLAYAIAAFTIAAVAHLCHPLLLPVSVWTSMSLEWFGDWSNKIDKISHNLMVTDFSVKGSNHPWINPNFLGGSNIDLDLVWSNSVVTALTKSKKIQIFAENDIHYWAVGRTKSQPLILLMNTLIMCNYIQKLPLICICWGPTRHLPSAGTGRDFSPSAGTGTCRSPNCHRANEKNIPLPTLGAQCWNWNSSAGTGSEPCNRNLAPAPYWHWCSFWDGTATHSSVHGQPLYYMPYWEPILCPNRNQI